MKQRANSQTHEKQLAAGLSLRELVEGEAAEMAGMELLSTLAGRLMSVKPGKCFDLRVWLDKKYFKITFVC